MKRLLLCLLAAFAISSSAIATAPTENSAAPNLIFAGFQTPPRDATNLLIRSEASAKAMQQGDECCKICRKGKACGNSCINRDYQCHQPPGCACDG